MARSQALHMEHCSSPCVRLPTIPLQAQQLHCQRRCHLKDFKTINIQQVSCFCSTISQDPWPNTVQGTGIPFRIRWPFNCCHRWCLRSPIPLAVHLNFYAAFQCCLHPKHFHSTQEVRIPETVFNEHSVYVLICCSEHYTYTMTKTRCSQVFDFWFQCEHARNLNHALFQYAKYFFILCKILNLNPLDARRRLTDFSQTSYAAGSRLTYKTVNQRSGS